MRKQHITVRLTDAQVDSLRREGELHGMTLSWAIRKRLEARGNPRLDLELEMSKLDKEGK